MEPAKPGRRPHDDPFQDEARKRARETEDVVTVVPIGAWLAIVPHSAWSAPTTGPPSDAAMRNGAFVK